MFDDKHMFTLPHIFEPLAEIVIGQKLSFRILRFLLFYLVHSSYVWPSQPFFNIIFLSFFYKRSKLQKIDKAHLHFFCVCVLGVGVGQRLIFTSVLVGRTTYLLFDQTRRGSRGAEGSKAVHPERGGGMQSCTSGRKRNDAGGMDREFEGWKTF